MLYHAECNDGFAAAWVAHSYFEGECECVPVHYNKPPPPLCLSGPPRDILIVDFSYPRGVLIELAIKNNSVTVLDHHNTAAMDLNFLPPAPSITEWEIHRNVGFNFPLTALFDMQRSGAGITWDWFHPGEVRPNMINYVEDRDLWAFKDPDTRFIHAALSSYDHDFAKWTALGVSMEDSGELLSLIAEGQTLDRKHLQTCKQIIKATRRTLLIDTYMVPTCNAPYMFASDIGNILSKGHPFAATYVDHAEGRTFSLRSSKDGVDVSVVAKKFGGGGHKRAAGFTVGRNWEGA